MSIIILITLFSFSLVSSEAPYPPNGFKPQGRQFTLPNINRRPNNEYGPPRNQWSNAAPESKPSNQYLPTLDSSFIRSAGEVQPVTGNRQQIDARDNQNNFGQRDEQSRFYGRNQEERFGQEQQKGWTAVSNQGDGAIPNLAFGAGSRTTDRTYLTPPSPNFNEQTPIAKTQFSQLGDFDNDDVIGANRNAANQNYIPPRKQRPRQKFPESTTPHEPNDDVYNDAENPNIAVSKAVANAGQYYLLQPDGNLQRVMYKTTQMEDDIMAKLIYQNVAPISQPIYSYNVPYIGFN